MKDKPINTIILYTTQWFKHEFSTCIDDGIHIHHVKHINDFIHSYIFNAP